MTFPAMSLNDLDPSNFSPFASFVAMRAKVPAPDKQRFAYDLSDSIIPPKGWSEFVALPQPATSGMQPEFVLAMIEERVVSWDKTGDFTDRLHHLVVGFIDGEFALVYASDPQLKLRLQDALIDAQLRDWYPVEQKVLNTAFLLGQKLRALWLGATHRSVDVRPDTKVLSGPNVREAIDPFGDATFMPSAARSSSAGVSLKRSGIWTGGKGDWDNFCQNAGVLTAAMHAAVASNNLIDAVDPFLASWCSSIAGVTGAYDICLADPESFDPGAAMIHRLEEIEGVEMSLTSPPAGATQPPEALFLVLGHLSAPATINALLTPRIEGERVRFNLSLPAGVVPAFAKFKEIIESNSELLRVYYTSGHTISGATLSESTVQDNDFTGFVDGNFDLTPPLAPFWVDKEKPGGKNMAAWVPKMSDATDLSLFSWVRRVGIGQLALAPLAAGTCWLYCDDGSGEVADFLHVSTPANQVPRITAIHVKGANNRLADRQISVGAYEVVVGQAIKNLRQILAQGIKRKIDEAVGKPGPPRVWDASWPAPSTAAAQATLQTALAAINVQCDYEVVIVQPHVRRSYYTAQLASVPARKLRTLLFGALAMARSAGAPLRVVIDGV